MSKKKKIILFALMMLANCAFADRVIHVPPIFVASIAGGTGGGKTCVSANMLNPSQYLGANVGVKHIAHTVQLAFTNVSSPPIAQNLKVFVTGGSVVSHNSNGTDQSTPDTDGPSATGTYSPSDWFTVPAGGSRTLRLEARCNSVNCGLREVDPAYPYDQAHRGIIYFGNVPQLVKPCLGAEQVCLALNTYLGLKIVVQGDNGALIAVLHTQTHRCQGFVNEERLLPMVLIAGGRPF